MASPKDQAATMLANVAGKTGKTLKEWHRLLAKTGLEKHGKMVSLLKEDHGVTHGFANLIVTLFRDAGSTATEADLVDAQYAHAKQALRPIYAAIIEAVEAFGADVEIAARKSYVSLRRKKQFGLIQASTATRVDVGLNLPAVRATKRLEASGSFNSMVSHRVRLGSLTDVDDQLIGWLEAAYANAG